MARGRNCRGGEPASSIPIRREVIRNLEGENARALGLATANFLHHLVHSSTANPARSLSPLLLTLSVSLSPPYDGNLPTGMGKGKIRCVLAIAAGRPTGNKLAGWSLRRPVRGEQIHVDDIYVVVILNVKRDIPRQCLNVRTSRQLNHDVLLSAAGNESLSRKGREERKKEKRSINFL